MFTVQKDKPKEDAEVKAIHYSDKTWTIYIDLNVTVLINYAGALQKIKNLILKDCIIFEIWLLKKKKTLTLCSNVGSITVIKVTAMINGVHFK